MRILIATEVIHPGGAETFLLRLSQALQKKGHEVVIFNFHKNIYNKELKDKIAPNVEVVCAASPTTFIAKFTDALLFRLGIDLSLKNLSIKKSLQKLISEFKPDIIHSHLFKTDIICCEVAVPSGVPVVSTMHGDYAMYYNSTQKGEKISILNFKKKLRFLLQELKSIICISKEQEDLFANEMQNLIPKKLHLTKIYNGYSAEVSAATPLSRNSLNIPDNAFVYGMVARGIPSKGWEELIAAFTKLDNKKAYLVLVGGSEYVNALQEKHKHDTRIVFAGTVTNPLEWIRIFDVGLLPSYFGSESLPTVIMEYLYCNKPVIATRIGEIPAMIEYDGQVAGLLVEITNGKTNVDQLHEAMLRIYEHDELYRSLKNATKKCFEQFDMDRCVTAYEEIYKQYTS